MPNVMVGALYLVEHSRSMILDQASEKASLNEATLQLRAGGCIGRSRTHRRKKSIPGRGTAYVRVSKALARIQRKFLWPETSMGEKRTQR